MSETAHPLGAPPHPASAPGLALGEPVQSRPGTIPRAASPVLIVDTNFPTEDTLRRIREEFISQATVAVVLVGPCTWQRKFVDWEIGAALRDTEMNPRCGLLGILLPNHQDFGKPSYNAQLIPPRLADNCSDAKPFASIVDWPGRKGADDIQGEIHQVFRRRREQPDPDNSRAPFGSNWNRSCAAGWQD